MVSIDCNTLKYIHSYNTDDFLGCDFTEKDGSDPNGVHGFIHTDAQLYQENNLCVVYTVKYDDKTCGYFTLSMKSIEVGKLRQGDQLDVSHLPSYPAILLGYLGVEKKFRGKGIGSCICKYCIGFAIDSSKTIGCGYVVLQTTSTTRVFYDRLDFVTSGNEHNGKIWMYRRFFQIIGRRALSEHVQISDRVSATVIKTVDHKTDQDHSIKSNE